MVTAMVCVSPVSSASSRTSWWVSSFLMFRLNVYLSTKILLPGYHLVGGAGFRLRRRRAGQAQPVRGIAALNSRLLPGCLGHRLPGVAETQDDRYRELGRVVEMAAVMEVSLRIAFTALTGSKYAAVVAASQETHWLIENCDAISRQHRELAQEQRGAIRHALRACRQANHDRNRLVHEAWGADDGGDAAAINAAPVPGTRRGHQPGGPVWTIAEIRAVADAVIVAQQELRAAVAGAFGPESLDLALQLETEGFAAEPGPG
jgi:hypothetical protein